MAKFLDADSRQKCWSNRDIYFECLEKNNGKNESCTVFFDEFMKTCPKAWVKHFISKREAEKLKEIIAKPIYFEDNEKS